MGHETTIERDGDTLAKRGRSDEGRAAIDREREQLAQLPLATLGAIGAPLPLGGADGMAFYPYLGEHHDPDPKHELRVFDALTLRLEALREARLRHGDLTSANMIWRHDSEPADPIPLYFVDWGDITTLDEEPRKQRDRDVVTALQAMPHWGIDTSRIARRWIAILKHQRRARAGTYEAEPAGQLFDYGCNRGIMSRLAYASGYRVVALDRDVAMLPPQRPDGLITLRADLGAPEALPGLLSRQPSTTPAPNSIGLLLSVLPYVINEQGWGVAEYLVRTLAGLHQTLYVECQESGDGPGPADRITQGDWGLWLSQFGELEDVVTIRVHGRPHNRTVFALTA